MRPFTPEVPICLCCNPSLVPIFDCFYWLLDLPSWSSPLHSFQLSLIELSKCIHLYREFPYTDYMANICFSGCQRARTYFTFRLFSSLKVKTILCRRNTWIVCTGRYEKPFCYNLFVSRGSWTCTEENVSNFYSIIFLFQNRIQMYTLKLHWI